jgi:hypothetical protein
MPEPTSIPRLARIVGLLCGVMGACYGFAGVEPGSAVTLGFRFVPFLAVAFWFELDARRARRMPVAHDYGMLAWAIWPVYLPWYAIRTRGRAAGWRLAGKLLLVMIAPGIGMVLGALAALAAGRGG